jgi:hypothetical protein
MLTSMGIYDDAITSGKRDRQNQIEQESRALRLAAQMVEEVADEFAREGNELAAALKQLGIPPEKFVKRISYGFSGISRYDIPHYHRRLRGWNVGGLNLQESGLWLLTETSKQKSSMNPDTLFAYTAARLGLSRKRLLYGEHGSPIPSSMALAPGGQSLLHDVIVSANYPLVGTQNGKLVWFQAQTGDQSFKVGVLHDWFAAHVRRLAQDSVG